jgi:hypothetical protein
MTRPRKVLHPVLALSVILAFSFLASAKAELLVLDATGVDITPGTKLPDDHIFRLPRRSEVKLIRLPDNASFVMRGRYEGTLSKFIEDCRGFRGSLTGYCKENPTGEINSTGGTRGMGQ